MRIALVSVNAFIPCDGFRLILALLRRDGHDVTALSLPRPAPQAYTEHELTQLGRATAESELIMLSVYSAFSARAIQVSEYLRGVRPDRKIVWGGPHCVASPEACLRHADAVCFAEGDEAVPLFVDRLAAGDPAWLATPNMAFRTPAGPRINPVLAPTANLDALPFYDYSFKNEFILDGALEPVGTELLRRHLPVHPFMVPTATFLTSRGCPHHCAYCNNCRYVALHGGRVPIRRQSVGRFMDEVEYTLARLPFVERVLFGDDDFLIRPVAELETFAARYRKTVGLPFAVCLSANTYRRAKLDVLLDCGLKIVQIGVQSGSQRVLDEVYDRGVRADKAMRVIAETAPLLAQRGGLVLADFIVDNPYETGEDVLATYRFLVDLPHDAGAEIFSLVFFPGTPLYERALADGHIRPFDPAAFRDYTSRAARHQVNYPLLLIRLLEALREERVHRRLPRRFLQAFAARPVVRLMRLVPRPLMGWLIRRLPGFVRRAVQAGRRFRPGRHAAA
jgi:anaerobic magnesium-protoporphyrin IX monomethyl ester cyclase